MLEEMLMNVVQAMSNCLDEEQLDKLQNHIYTVMDTLSDCCCIADIIHIKRPRSRTGAASCCGPLEGVNFFVSLKLEVPFSWN